MNGLILLLLLCCCGGNSRIGGCGCQGDYAESNSNDCDKNYDTRYDKERVARNRRDEYDDSCSCRDKEATWTPYMSNSNRDNYERNNNRDNNCDYNRENNRDNRCDCGCNN